MCEKCENDNWIYTENGCAFQDVPETLSSSVDVAPAVSSESPIAVSTSATPEEKSNAGMIIGIVVGVLAALVIVAIIIYFVVTAGAKRSKIDPSIYEEDLEFSTMSML